MGVNKVVYGGETLIDLTGDTVTPETLAEGETAHDASGNKITGKMRTVTLSSISIITPPTKTQYRIGELFDPSGMVVRAIYSNGAEAVINGYVYTPSGALDEGTAFITIQYTDSGVTASVAQSITVKKGVDAVFSNNDWADIIAACESGSVPDTWVVGNSKTMTINGTSYQIDIIGKNHDTYAAGGVAPLTFQMHDCYNALYPINSSSSKTGGWINSDMRNTTLPSLLAKMPSEVQTGIKNVNKSVSTGGDSAISTVAEKLFLLSEVEVFGVVKNSHAGEGSRYAYYAAGNPRTKKFNGSLKNWWGRSPKNSAWGGTMFFCVNGNDEITGSEWAPDGESNGYTPTLSIGVAFAFCF